MGETAINTIVNSIFKSTAIGVSRNTGNTQDGERAGTSSERAITSSNVTHSPEQKELVFPGLILENCFVM